MRKIMAISLILSALSLPVYAQSGIAAAAQTRIVAPFIDDQTFAIVRIDLRRINAEQVFDKIIAAIQLPPGDKLNDRFPAAKTYVSKLVADFTQAGGRDIYIIFSMIDFPGFFAIAPLRQNSDSQALVQLISQNQPAGSSKNSPIYWDTIRPVGSVLFAGPQETFKRFQSAEQLFQRPELLAAFAAAGDHAFQALLIPSPDQRRIIEEIIPILPQPMAGQSSKIITQGVMWLALGLNTPPKMSLNLTAQSPDPDAAQAVNKLIANLYQNLRQDEKIRQIVPKLDTFLAQLFPAVDRNRILLALDDGAINTLITDLVPTIYARARAGAHRIQCTSNFGAIVRSIIMYQGEYKDKLPPNLEILIETENLHPLSLVCPATNDKLGQVSYVYRGSDKYNPYSEDMILVHDKLGNHPGGFVNVLFVNSSVKTMSEKEFLQAIDQDNKLRKEKGLPEIPVIK